MLKKSRFRWVAGGAIGLLPPLLSLPAGADLTVTSETRVVRPADASQNQIGETRPDETRGNTLYYRGDRARVEHGDGTVTLYDLKAGRVYLLSPADKTYSTLSLGDFLKRDPFAVSQDAAGRAANVKTDVRVDLKKDAVVEAKQFAGFSAQVYDLTGSVTVSVNRPSSGGRGGFPGSGRRGGRRGGGGFPGGGFPGGLDFQAQDGGGFPAPNSGGRGASAFQPAQFDGEIWLSAPNILKTKTKVSWLPLLQASVPSARLIQPLADKITKFKGFPLASKITVSGRNSQSSSGGTYSATVYSTVKTISEAPLDEALFKIPADYQRLDAR